VCCSSVRVAPQILARAKRATLSIGARSLFCVPDSCQFSSLDVPCHRGFDFVELAVALGRTQPIECLTNYTRSPDRMHFRLSECSPIEAIRDAERGFLGRAVSTKLHDSGRLRSANGQKRRRSAAWPRRSISAPSGTRTDFVTIARLAVKTNLSNCGDFSRAPACGHAEKATKPRSTGACDRRAHARRRVLHGGSSAIPILLTGATFISR
jgi:hypothetical protein